MSSFVTSLSGSTTQEIVNWVTTADGCVHTADTTQLKSTSAVYILGIIQLSRALFRIHSISYLFKHYLLKTARQDGYIYGAASRRLRRATMNSTSTIKIETAAALIATVNTLIADVTSLTSPLPVCTHTHTHTHTRCTQCTLSLAVIVFLRHPVFMA